MMKKLLSYAIPLVAAAGIMSCRGCKPDSATAELEKAMYGDFEKGVTTCLYDWDNHFWASYTPTQETGCGVYYNIKIQDPNGIKTATRCWGKLLCDNDEPEDRGCEYTINENLTIASPSKNYFEKHPLVFTVTDCKGDVKEYKFTLEDMIKKSEPIKKIINKGKCPEKIE